MYLIKRRRGIVSPITYLRPKAKAAEPELKHYKTAETNNDYLVVSLKRQESGISAYTVHRNAKKVHGRNQRTGCIVHANVACVNRFESVGPLGPPIPYVHL